MRWSSLLILSLTACTPTDESPTDLPDEDETPIEAYDFTSPFGDESSVAYSGQIARQVLIGDLKLWMGGLTARIDAGWYPESGDVEDELAFYFDFDSDTSGDLDIALGSDLPFSQSTYADVSTGKDLVGKIAGNDPVGQHVDWNTVGIVGWDDGIAPEALVRDWFATIDEQAVDWSTGNPPLDPSGQPVPAVYITSEGRDLLQLSEKFLRGAVSFSQATDDYLDDTEPGKGLLSDHTALEDGKPYTALEHQWDEGFGYFGAARTYPVWTDEEIAGGFVDVNGDGEYDLLTEVSWGHSTNAGKRDRDSVIATDFTQEAWDGFAAGRELLSTSPGPLSDDEQQELRDHADAAILAWEKAIAATVVHYINDTLQDMDAIGTDDYSFGDHAKHWSEMKGFALSFQFNPRSPLANDFAALHDLLGTAPALEGDDLAAYESDLLDARALIGNTYGFDAANLGDDDGLGGW